MNKKTPMSVKSAMSLFEKLESNPQSTSKIVDALNTIIISDDVAHMSRKGLRNAILYMAQNLDSLASAGPSDEDVDKEV